MRMRPALDEGSMRAGLARGWVRTGILDCIFQRTLSLLLHELNASWGESHSVSAV